MIVLRADILIYYLLNKNDLDVNKTDMLGGNLDIFFYKFVIKTILTSMTQTLKINNICSNLSVGKIKRSNLT